MRVRDFAAELISEVAEETGYVVYKYECALPSCGNIVFEKEAEDGVKRYKILDYSNHEVHLHTTMGRVSIDLHDPSSLEDLRDWFENDTEAYDFPLGSGILGGYQAWPSLQPTPQAPASPNHHQITITPNTVPNSHPGWTPTTFPWNGVYTSGGTFTSGTSVAPSIHTVTSNKPSVFGFSSFGSLLDL